MRAILRTDNPSALPDDLLTATKNVRRNRNGRTYEETFAVVEGIAGAGTLSDDSGVRLFLDAEDNGLLSDWPEKESNITHGGPDADFTAELVSAGDDDTHFMHEPDSNLAHSEVTDE